MGYKSNISLIIIGIILVSGAGYVFGQSPIAGLREESLTLQSQITQLTDTNTAILDRLEGISADLSETQNAFETLLATYNHLSEVLTSTQSELQGLVSSFDDLQSQLVEAQANNCNLIGRYSSVWEKYADLLMAYNNLTSEEPIGEMVITEISGIVNGDWENGNEGWLTQGVSNLVGGVKFLHKNDRGTFTTQSVTLTNKNQGVQFKVKPQPFGGEISLEVSVKGVVLYVADYSGINSQFDWEIITIPFKPLMNMREQYGFPIIDIYDVRFTVLAGEDTGANIAFDDVKLVEIDYQPEEPSASPGQTGYLRNGGFEESVQYDPWEIPGWGGGGTVGVYEGYIGKAVYLYQWSQRHRSGATQLVSLDTSPMTITFWIKPFPESNSVGFEFIFDGEVLFKEHYTGENNEYDWEKITIILEPETGLYEIRFSVLTGPEYYPENMSHVAIDEVSISP